MVNTTLPVKYLPLKTTFMRFHHIVFVVTIIFFLSCKKEASRDQPYKDVLTSGPWQISSLDVGHLVFGSPDTTIYQDTSVYHGYDLIFYPDGKLQAAIPGSISATGTWYQYSYEHTETFYVRIEIGVEEFSYLNGIWTFIEHSLSQIDLDITSYGIVYTMTLLKK